MRNYLKPKYILIIIPVVIVALALLTPFFSGCLFKHDYLAFLDNINSQSKFKIDVLEYHVGWLNSSVKLSVTLPPSPANQGRNLNATIDQQISHGPVVLDPVQHKISFALAGVQSNFHVPKVLEKMLLANQNDEGLMQIYSLIAFNFSVTNQINLPVFNITSPYLGTINWQGMNGTINFHTINHMTIDAFNSNLTSGEFSFNSNDPNSFAQQLLISSSTMTNNLTTQTNKLMDGESELSVASIAIKKPDNNITVTGINAKRTFGMDGNDFYKMVSQITVNKFDAPDFVVPVISPIKINFSINKLSANGLIQFMSELKSSNANSVNETPANKISREIPQIITSSTTISTDISADTSLGTLLLDGKAYWPANLALPKTADDLNANGAFKVNIKIAIPLVAAIVEKYAASTPYGMPTQAEADQQAATTADSAKNPLNDAVAILMEKGVIELPTSLQIMQMGNQDNSIEAFSADISRLNLQPQVVATLLEQFKLVLAEKKSAAEAASSAPAKLSPADKVKAKIAEWINDGFIVQDKDYYSTSITREGGKIMVNGKMIQ